MKSTANIPRKKNRLLRGGENPPAGRCRPVRRPRRHRNNYKGTYYCTTALVGHKEWSLT